VISVDATIEEALRIVTITPEDEVPVVDSSGRLVGTVTLRQLTAALL